MNLVQDRDQRPARSTGKVGLEGLQQPDEDVWLPKRPKLTRGFPQPPHELPALIRGQLQDRHEFAEPPGRHSRPVDGPRISTRHAAEQPGERLEAGAKDFVTGT